MGIGTLGERSLHAMLKNWAEPDEQFHEQKVGPYVADIRNKSGIIEIQTGSFTKLQKRLDYYLFQEKLPVRVIYPVPKLKWLVWLDPETGEATKRRKSPKQWEPISLLPELCHILDALESDLLSFTVVLMELEEHRSLCGWSADRKRGSRRAERYPLNLLGQVDLNCRADFLKLLPPDLPDPFTAKEFGKAARMSPRATGRALAPLRRMDLVRQCGKRKNAYLYTLDHPDGR